MSIIIVAVFVVESECGKSSDGSRWSTKKALEDQVKVLCFVLLMTGVMEAFR